ncbi:unnamed protein product, partial [Phaeothamnion confervicola]
TPSFSNVRLCPYCIAALGQTHLTAAGENLRPDYVAESPEETRSRIEKMVTDNEVMLFMKGNKLFPQCGFSNTAVQVLRACDVKFETFDVLADPEVRQGIKDYASWPTIPQLYLKAQLVGGSDIMIDLFQSGELKKMFDEAGVAVTTE